MNEGTLRGVKIAAIAMAVLIVLGTTTLFVLMAKRGIAPAENQPAASLVAPGQPSSNSGAPIAASVVLDEPPGTRIAGIASARDRLAVHLTGGGADRIVFLDPATGRVTGRVALGQ